MPGLGVFETSRQLLKMALSILASLIYPYFSSRTNCEHALLMYPARLALPFCFLRRAGCSAIRPRDVPGTSLAHDWPISRWTHRRDFRRPGAAEGFLHGAE